MGFDLSGALQSQRRGELLEVTAPSGERIRLYVRGLFRNSALQTRISELLEPIRRERIAQLSSEEAAALQRAQDVQRRLLTSKDPSDVPGILDEERAATWRADRLLEIPRQLEIDAGRRAMAGTVLVGWEPGDFEPPVPVTIDGVFNLGAAEQLLQLPWIADPVERKASDVGQVEQRVEELAKKGSPPATPGSEGGEETSAPPPPKKSRRTRRTKQRSSKPADSAAAPATEP
ncbi:MAG: hypothetical protein AAGN46_01240 [Acidobacteriota bacterium]